MLYERGLAYQAEALVNYDPVDKTVLANEQVDGNGRSWRSGALVQQIKLRQWFFKITDFQDDLLKDLDVLAENNRWPERVVTQQRNWIGRSHGAKISFRLQHDNSHTTDLNVFTTRPDTLFGVKYIALSLSHPTVLELASTMPELQAFLNKKAAFGPDSKDGYELPMRAVNPLGVLDHLSESTVPVFAAPYVLDDYGEGAVMGVPAHDLRDLAFWKLHRSGDTAPIVVARADADIQNLEPLATTLAEADTAKGVLTGLCGKYAGLTSDEASQKIISDLAQHGHAEATKTWRLRDWLVSRQRYWGTPIPIIHCASCGTVPVPERDLPVELPQLDSSFRGQTGNPLDKCESWINTTCPSCGRPGKRETDTMDTFVDSSWYYMRFPDSRNEVVPFSKESATSMLPVDTYVGGVEHAILHLLYARFIYKFLCREGLVPTKNAVNEPFSQLIAQGMVHGKTFSDPATGRFLKPEEVDHTGSEPVIVASQAKPGISYEKMSKSKYNGVDPSLCIAKYGADATRAHILFAAPVSEVLQWDEEKIIGIQRWFQRVIRLVSEVTAVKRDDTMTADLNSVSDADANILLLTQKTLRSVTNTLQDNIYGLNTYISDVIKLTNGIFETSIDNLTPWVAEQSTRTLLQMIAPVAPAFAEECWEALTNKQTSDKSIFHTTWPSPVLTASEEKQLKSREKTQKCAVQINGKLRFVCEVPLTSKEKMKSKDHEDAVIAAVLGAEAGKTWLSEKHNWNDKKKVIVVRGGAVVNVVF